MFDTLSEKFSDAFKNIQGKGKISEQNIEDTLKLVKTALLEADVNFKVVKDFIAKVKDQAMGEKVLRGVNPGEQFVSIVHEELAAVMGDKHEELELNRPINPVLIVGLNGAGKTTFSGKLAHFLQNKEKKDVLLVPADTFRPGAKAQLITLAKSANLDYFDSDLSLTPDKIVEKGLAAAKEQNKSVVIFDTAGRLHIDDELMAEIKKVRECLKDPEVLLVADVMTGQEAVNVAKTFHEAVGLTGVVLSKMDSDARGGAALSIRYATGVPLRFISVGEKLKDLEKFHPDRMAQRILDMGDVLTLVEKAQEVIDEKEAEATMKKMEKGRFTMDDFLKQMNMMNKLGSMESLLKMIPGMGGALRQMGDLSAAEGEMNKIKSIIYSMTPEERNDHKLLKNESRKQRIARGCGRTVSDVNAFYKKFLQMQQMMQGMMGMMKGGGMPGLPGMGGGMPDLGNLGGIPGMGKRKKGKGKGRGPWGKKYF